MFGEILCNFKTQPKNAEENAFETFLALICQSHRNDVCVLAVTKWHKVHDICLGWKPYISSQIFSYKTSNEILFKATFQVLSRVALSNYIKGYFIF